MTESDEVAALRARCNKDNMYFVTRGIPVEITSIEEVFNYGNQCLLDRRDEVDQFGRCYLDKMFITLCIFVHFYFDSTTIKSTAMFRSLSCQKEGDNYVVRVQYDDKVLEMELLEMVRHFEQLCDSRGSLK